MQSQELHDFLFRLYDFADYLADQVETGAVDERDAGLYYVSMAFIETIFDTYGRALVSRTAAQSGLDPDAELSEAHRRIDLLRNRGAKLNADHQYDDSVRWSAKKLLRDWGGIFE